MKFKISLCCFCFILSGIKGIAQTISGTVFDQNTNESLIGVTILVKNTTVGTTTDLDGKFSLDVKQALPVTLVFSYIGYVSKEVAVSNTNTPLKIKLGSDEILLKDVEISDTRLTEKQRESPLTVEAMDIIAIKETPAANFYEGLGQLKGVDVTSASLGFKVINTRGFNSTSPVRSLQIIDGVDNQSPGLNFSLGNFLGASELDVLKVDLIVGASSAFYGPNAFNGVISMNTKSPFIKPGLSVMAKAGERNMLEGAVRYSQVFKDKNNKDRFAYKVNAYFLRADDWVADNLDPTQQSRNDASNPGGYDAINVYGDEYNAAFDYSAVSVSRPGLGIFYRRGYHEKDLVDYDTRNIKLSTALHYKIKDENELIFASSFGYGTTVYQGENRYSLRDIQFFQNRIEYKKDNKFFIRAYATHESAGKSFDAFLTAILMQNAAKSDIDFALDYSAFWGSNYSNKLKNLPGFPQPAQYATYEQYVAAINPFLFNNYYDTLIRYHGIASAYANGVGSPNKDNLAFFDVGSDRFDSAYAAITNALSSQGGSRLYDKSALYHIHGEHKFDLAFAQLTAGANYRLYEPNSKGTIFRDTGNVSLSNSEFGVYTGLDKSFNQDKCKVNLTMRLDKNENFDYLFSPALSLVYNFNKNHVSRLSFSSAIRNPTLADQYLYYNVGRAILIGNLEGFDSLVTIPSLFEAMNSSNPQKLDYFNIDPVQPEKVKTIEVGHRASLFNKLFVDAGMFYSWYDDFIGFKLGADVDYLSQFSLFQINNVYRASANAEDQVVAYGAAAGINYFFARKWSFNGNYSYNKLDRKGSDDPLIPAYNTPEHKFNVGFGLRESRGNIKLLNKIWNVIPEIPFNNWGLNVNFKWIEGFQFEGSPQFTGFIDSYHQVDVQVNKYIPSLLATFKIGAANVLDNQHYEAYGGPKVGRLAYFSVLVDLSN
ncbi:MAG TPA: TonB-dependent receptor [Bacteroidia bacterium]|nr:TonB-dependent receptor [Bacteroidia bacterium]HNT80621.1 TonB-dependent receptor [Bacteroidia bacterium]